MYREQLIEYAEMLEGIAAELRMQADAEAALEMATTEYGVTNISPVSTLPRVIFRLSKAADLVAASRMVKNQFIRGGGGPVMIVWDNGREVVLNSITEVDNELGA